MLLVLNASPYHQGKHAVREPVLGERAREDGLPLIYCNLIGGQDDLLFDGQVCCWAATAGPAEAPAFDEHLLLIDVELAPGAIAAQPWIGRNPSETPPRPRSIAPWSAPPPTMSARTDSACAARTVRRHRFGADAGDRRRRARGRARQGGRCPRATPPSSAMTRRSRRPRSSASVSRRCRSRRRATLSWRHLAPVFADRRPTPPKKTCNRAAAACC